jgi:mannose-1-phosphate guanylyltransferase/mannose-6-phosphate isomerase
MSVIIPVILCGGSGTRLWPLSRINRPKQFISLTGNHSLLEDTLERARTIIGAIEPICVSAAANGSDVRQSLAQLGLRGRVVLEPEPRNTGPALTAASLVARGTDQDAIIVALPADHIIENNAAFAQCIERACAAAKKGWLTIIGIKPRFPSSALGYIEVGGGVEGLSRANRVKRFVEKPEQSIAEDLISRGALWNAGIVVARADVVIEAMRMHEPKVLEAIERSLTSGESDGDAINLEFQQFAMAPKISFDKAVLERHDAVAVIELDAMWRDVGTWVEVAELYAPDTAGNRRMGRVHLPQSRNSFVFSPDRLTVGIGLKDIVVVDTPDALLIANRNDLGLLREVVEDLSAAADREIATGIRSVGPDGLNGRGGSEGTTRVLRISLVPGESTRREPHNDVARYWIVAQGKVKVTVGKQISSYDVNQCIRVPPGLSHSISTVGTVAVKLIEVQLA